MLKSMSISTKLGAAFALVLATVAAMMLFIFQASREVSEVSENTERVEREESLAAAIENAILLSVANLRGYAVSGDVREVAALHANLARFHEAVDTLKPMLRDPKEIALLDASVRGANAWERDSVAPMLERMSAADKARAQQLLGRRESKTEIDNVIAGAETLRLKEFAAVESNLEEADHASRAEDWAMLVGAIMMTIVTVSLWAALRQLLGRPVISLTRVMEDLAAGNNAVAVPDVDRADELGSMAKAVLVFRDAAVAKQKAEAEKAIADAEQRQVVDTLANGLGRLAKGDLTADIPAGFPASYGTVRDNFNSALRSLRELIGAVLDATRSIRGSSGEIAQASEDLARRTGATAASLEETSAALTQMDGRLRIGAQASTRTVACAEQAIGSVGSGRSMAEEAVQAMRRVSERARGIDTVIEGVDKIAFQTRVLAMNAAVEAGRAGEAGRGFAVVADLVSALAMRAEEEARTAREQLTATQDEIVTAVGAVERVDGALGQISEGVAEVHTLLGTMANDNQAQSSAVSEITSAVNSMDQATQQNAAMVEQASAATRNLSDEVAALADQAARFEVGDRTRGGERVRAFAAA